jgi:hypothetical protein
MPAFHPDRSSNKFATVLAADPPWMKLSALWRPVDIAPPSAESREVDCGFGAVEPVIKLGPGCLFLPRRLVL